MNDFTGGPGFLAFVFTFALVIAGVVLFRSLSKHLRKVKGASSTSSEVSVPPRQGTAAAADEEETAAPKDPKSPDEGSGDQPAR